jgi:hypothetical protein
MSKNANTYERCLTGSERMFTWSPYAIVSMVARIKGEINIQDLRNAIIKVQQRHTLLRVRIKIDENNIPWFTSENVETIPIAVVPRKNDKDWVEIIRESSKLPFNFEKQNPIRFFLVHH